ncbi:LysR family transcriptional regulator [Nocardia alni]|uniref:LysR family transcriptional regulator n=1 Tax=Nocardia alni TaxID=2815723 RepID=UPI001C24BC56|nr:LysR family transcriptional regulator [Nocardia alni]
MDVVAACRAFVSVSSHGSFTAGAAAARIPQSVASRRVAALEEHLGGRLLDRTSRTATLTPFGRDLLPSARRLVELAEAMRFEAERARRRPLRMAVPAVCGPLPLARLVADGQRLGVNLDLHPAQPRERAELARTQEVRAALVAVPADRGIWRIPLGLADIGGPYVSPIFLETLRAGRADRDNIRRRIWIQPEDDVPHIRDRIVRLGDSLGLQPVQVVVAGALVTAVAAVLDSADLLLCSATQAAEFGLAWRQIGELDAARGYDIAAAHREDADRIGSLSSEAIGRCLGVLYTDTREQETGAV